MHTLEPGTTASTSRDGDWWNEARKIDAGAWLFRENEPVREVFRISEGLVKLVRARRDDRESVVGLRWPGSLVGAVRATMHDRHRLSARAVLPTKVRRLEAHRFRDGLRTVPEFLRSVTDAMLAEFRADLDDSTRGFLLNPEQRLRKLFGSDAGRHRNGGEPAAEICLPPAIAPSDLADLLHVSVKDLEPLLNKWQHSRYLRRAGGALIVNCTVLNASDPREPAEATASAAMPSIQAPAGSMPEAIADRRIRVAIALIRKQAANGRLDLKCVGRQVNLSLWHLSRLFKRSTGLGFREFLNAVRLDRAREALRTTHLSIKEIATIVGYNHTSDFTRRFKAAHGMCPTEYRAKMTKR
jgi:AraC-like DNA-binding protein/CRP-like cAMP-binding protein